jgi:hypothetical protein
VRIDLLKDSQVAALASDVYNSLRGDPSRINEGFIEVFGGLLQREQSMKDDSDAPTVLVETLVESRNVVGLEWVLHLLREDAQLFSRANQRIVAALQERVEHALEPSEDDGRDQEGTAKVREVLLQLEGELRRVER